MKKSVLLSLLVAVVLMAAVPAVRAFNQAAGDSATVAAITKMENDAVKADLAGDASFYEKNLSDDWTGGTSRGTWDTKASLLADMKDTKNNKTNTETISALKVRVHGEVAIATYTTTYDAMIKGQHYARTVISTDTFHQMNGAWKVIAGHSSLVANK